MARLPRPSRRLTITLLAGACLVFGGWALFGALGAALALVTTTLLAAFRHDNDLGTCFPLAILFVLVLVFLTVLLMMLSMFAVR